MTVLFADLVESTRMIDGRDPEELMDGLAAYRMAIREAIERFRRLHPASSRRWRHRLLRLSDRQRGRGRARGAAGLAIVEAVAKLAAGPMALRVRVGIATRRHCQSGQPGDGPHRGQLHRRGAQYRGPPAGRGRARVRWSWRSRPRGCAQGSSSPGRSGHRRSRASPNRSRPSSSPASVRRASRFERRLEVANAPLINRHAERGLLLKLFGEAAARIGRRTIYIVGEPGIGKSRLAHVLGEIAERRRVQAIRPAMQRRARQHRASPAHRPPAEAVRHRGGGRRWRATRKAQGLSRHRAPFGSRGAGACSRASLDRLPRRAAGRHAAARAARAHAGDAARAPADRGERGAARPRLRGPALGRSDLAAISWRNSSRRAAQRVLLLIATTRPGSAAGMERPRQRHVAPSRPSHAEDSSRFAEAIGLGAGLSRIDIDRIVKRTDGVPLFVEEMTRMMLDAPDRARRADLPESLSDLLTERLDHLGPARRYHAGRRGHRARILRLPLLAGGRRTSR